MTKPIKNKTRMTMVRLTPEQADELTRLAELNKKKMTVIIREMIDFGLKNIQRPKISRIDKAHLKANFESLYIMRKLANRVDDSISREAQTEAKKILEVHFESDAVEGSVS